MILNPIAFIWVAVGAFNIEDCMFLSLSDTNIDYNQECIPYALNFTFTHFTQPHKITFPTAVPALKILDGVSGTFETLAAVGHLEILQGAEDLKFPDLVRVETLIITDSALKGEAAPKLGNVDHLILKNFQCKALDFPKLLVKKSLIIEDSNLSMIRNVFLDNLELVIKRCRNIELFDANHLNEFKKIEINQCPDISAISESKLFKGTKAFTLHIEDTGVTSLESNETFHDISVNNSNLVSMNFPSVTELNSLWIENNPSLVNVNFPTLTDIECAPVPQKGSKPIRNEDLLEFLAQFNSDQFYKFQADSVLDMLDPVVSPPSNKSVS